MLAPPRLAGHSLPHRMRPLRAVSHHDSHAPPYPSTPRHSKPVDAGLNNPDRSGTQLTQSRLSIPGPPCRSLSIVSLPRRPNHAAPVHIYPISAHRGLTLPASYNPACPDLAMPLPSSHINPIRISPTAPNQPHPTSPIPTVPRCPIHAPPNTPHVARSVPSCPCLTSLAPPDVSEPGHTWPRQPIHT